MAVFQGKGLVTDVSLIPFADKLLIPPGPNDPAIIPIGIILHVDAGNSPSLYKFFRDRSGGIESHGHIRKDGDLEQYRDTEREADANYKANSFIKQGKRYGYNSFETQGFGEGEWTDQQIATIKQVLLWENKEHNVPLVVAPGPYEPGVGYHTLYPKDWSPVAKSCPGKERIEQFNDVLVPWMKKQGVRKHAT